MAAIVLMGCGSGITNVDYAGMVQKIGPPKAGQSRIVVLQEKSRAANLDSSICDVKLDGGLIGRLRAGTYVYVDRPAGRHQLLATETMFPGETKRDITTESGRTYFFLAKASG